MKTVRREFRFEERWWLPASPQTLVEVLTDLAGYPRWWPQVLAVAALGEDEARVLCRSKLPYTLDLVLHAVSRDLPTVEVEVSGDLIGSVAWTLVPERDGTAMHFEQRVTTDGALGLAAMVGGPILRWNHNAMMQGCLTGLRQEIAGKRS